MRVFFLAFVILISFVCASPNSAQKMPPEMKKLLINCIEKGSNSDCESLIEKYPPITKCDGPNCDNIIYARFKIHFEMGIYYSKRACDELDLGVACNILAKFYQEGKGVKKDIFVAKQHFEKGCALNSGDACNNLGILYVYGEGVSKNLSTAKEYFNKGCDLGTQIACDNYKRDKKAWLQDDGY